MYASKKQPFVTGDVDETVTDEGRKWTEFVIETGLALLNGNCVGDKRGEIKDSGFAATVDQMEIELEGKTQESQIKRYGQL